MLPGLKFLVAWEKALVSLGVTTPLLHNLKALQLLLGTVPVPCFRDPLYPFPAGPPRPSMH